VRANVAANDAALSARLKGGLQRLNQGARILAYVGVDMQEAALGPVGE